MTCYGASELARSFGTVRGNIIRIAEEIPEVQYDYRPIPESQSVKEILAHILVLSMGSYRGHAVRKITTFVGIDFAALIIESQARMAQSSGR